VKKYGSTLGYHEVLNKPFALVTDTKVIQLNQAFDFPRPSLLVHLWGSSAKELDFLKEKLIGDREKWWLQRSPIITLKYLS
jgi:hypothetical protein